MKKNESMTRIKDQTQADVESQALVWSEEVWTRAKGKAERWMRAAYGEVDWDGYEQNSLISDYMASIEKVAPGQRTHNRVAISGAMFNRKKGARS